MDIQKVLEELDCFIQEQNIEKIPSFFEEKYVEAKKQSSGMLCLFFIMNLWDFIEKPETMQNP